LILMLEFVSKTMRLKPPPFISRVLTSPPVDEIAVGIVGTESLLISIFLGNFKPYGASSKGFTVLPTRYECANARAVEILSLALYFKGWWRNAVQSCLA
jgi:hypothetical protein